MSTPPPPDRATPRMVRTSLAVPPELLDGLDLKAQEHDVTRSAEIRRALWYGYLHKPDGWVPPRPGETTELEHI